MNKQRVDVEEMVGVDVMYDLPNERIASSTEFDSVTNKN
jgi:hypothetical protein